MRQSSLFSKTRKESPKDEVAKNADLLIRAGFIHKDMAGVYSMLPLGLRTLNKIVSVIRSEMETVGGQEVHLASLQDKKVWEATDRWDDSKVDNWFKSKLKNDSDVGFAFTHEEPITKLMTEHIRSYKDLPRYVYQFQTKFRNETRAKSGIMRTREFLMKDMYSFSADEESHNEFYEKMKTAYKNIFESCGLGNITYLTFASGGTFAKYSHEFQTVTDAGEDTIHIHEGRGLAINSEVLNDEVLSDLKIDKGELVEKKAVEVGNIFSLGTKFSEPLNLVYKNNEGKESNVIMGSYGIGPARIMGTIAECLSDDKGLVWPALVSPFDFHIIHIDGNDSTNKLAKELLARLEKDGKSVLFDDRVAGVGEKLADSDLIGIPTRIIVSDRNTEGGVIEITDRKSGESKKIDPEDFMTEIQNNNVKN